MTALSKTLAKNIEGDVRLFDSDTKSYARDESIFTLNPSMIVCPKNSEDVETAVKFATEHRIPITARGGGSGVAGQSIGSGIILDFSVHMKKILEVTDEKAIVQPGVVLQTLNQELSKTNRMFAPDPGSRNVCTIGGMIANNAAGPRALMHGSTRDHVLDLDMVLHDGKTYKTSKMNGKFENLIGEIKKNEGLIRTSKKKTEKNSSGYHLEGLLEKPASFGKLFSGSEGTLGICTQAELRTIPIPNQTFFAVFAYESTSDAVESVARIRETKPLCIELLNQHILQMFQRIKPELIQEMGLQGKSAALWVEWTHEIPELLKSSVKFSTNIQDHIHRLWAERSDVSRHLHREAEKQNRKPLRCIEDACVPISVLPQYVKEIEKLLVRHDAEGAIFGHVGSGHLHINPGIRTDTPNLEKRIENLMDEFYAIVLGVGGTISGEHGDGMLRVKYAKEQWKEIWPLFETVKKSFDPHGIFNPDKKVPVIGDGHQNMKLLRSFID